MDSIQVPSLVIKSALLLLTMGCGSTSGPVPRPMASVALSSTYERGDDPRDREDYRNSDPIPTPIDPNQPPKLIASFPRELASDENQNIHVHLVSQTEFYVSENGKDDVGRPPGAYELVIKYILNADRWSVDSVKLKTTEGSVIKLHHKEERIESAGDEVDLRFKKIKPSGSKERFVDAIRVEARGLLVTFRLAPYEKKSGT